MDGKRATARTEARTGRVSPTKTEREPENTDALVAVHWTVKQEREFGGLWQDAKRKPCGRESAVWEYRKVKQKRGVVRKPTRWAWYKIKIREGSK